MHGYILIDKPTGWTSFDVVAKVRSLARQATGQKKVKVGHTGTLDPLATGLLIIVLGDYCRRAEEFSKLDKTYEATITLGQTSTTDDAEGDKTAVSDRHPSQTEVEAALTTFVGPQEQLPPAFSAIKVNGQRAYKLARKGSEVALKARPVTIYSIDDVTYQYPEVRCTVAVSSGTYIRSLARDVGQKLDTGAYLSSLRRTSVGRWQLHDAQQLDSLTPENLTKHLQTTL